ncbi:MAG TPA: hypothetical protein VF883_16020 [Thermoanaerobaculia bacterium]|jgi:hypothetical protein
MLNAWLAALIVALTGAAVPVAPRSEEPTVIVRRSNGLPLWIPATEAFTDSGDLREDLFPPHVRAQLHQVRDLNPERCEYAAVAPSLEIFEPVDSLENLAISAESVFSGAIVAAEPGFYDGNPGTLFSIQVDRAFKRGHAASTVPTVSLFLGIGEIKTPRGHICGRGLRGAVAPNLGDEVLFFAHLAPMDLGGRIFVVEPHKALLVQSKSHLTMPSALVDGHAPKDLAEAISRVRSVLGTDRTSKLH